jgi:4-amino-4-deoxy-L-arabinose transferase-like glycosyltransferase
MSDRANRLLFSCGLLVIVGVGSAARLWQIRESLWLDELHTSWVVSDTFEAITPRARMGNQGPGYFYIVRLSTLALGENELALRMPSLLAGIGLILVVGVITWRWCGVIWAGWLAAILVALDGNMIFFSQEARTYALVQLIALLQLAAFWKLQTQPRGELRLAVVVGWIVLFQLHYTTALLIAGELLWWAAVQWWQRGKGAYRPAQLLCDVGLTVAACAITWQHLAEIATRRSMWELFISKQPPWVALGWFHWDVYVLSTVLICPGLTAVAYFFQAKGRWQRGGDEPRTTIELQAWSGVVPLLVLWWSAPVVIAWSLTVSDLARVFFPRYLMGVAVAPMVCAGLGLTICRGPRTRTLAAVAITSLAVIANGLVGQFLDDGRLIADRQQDWRGAVEWLNEGRDVELPVFVRSGLIEADRLRTESNHSLEDLCILPVTGLYSIRKPAVIYPLTTSRSGRLSSQAIRLLEQHQGGWFVINMRPSMHATFRRDLHASFPGAQLQFLRERSFGNVTVWQLHVTRDR